jgi:hypothetical protein
MFNDIDAGGQCYKNFSSSLRKRLNKIEHSSLGKKFYDNFVVVNFIKLFSSFQAKHLNELEHFLWQVFPA